VRVDHDRGVDPGVIGGRKRQERARAVPNANRRAVQTISPALPPGEFAVRSD